MMKKLLAGLMALSFLNSSSLLQVYAQETNLAVASDVQSAWECYYYGDVEKNTDGNAEAKVNYQLGTFVIITDGSDLTLPDENDYFSESTIQELHGDDLQIFTDNDSSQKRYFKIDVPLTMKIKEDDGEYIQYNEVAVNSIYSSEVRKYIQLNDHILDVVKVCYEADALIDWDGDFTASLIGIDESPLDISTFDGYQEAISELETMKTTLTGYDLLVTAKEKASLLTELNADQCYLVQATIHITPDMESANYEVKSAINCTGDVNADDKVDASDAAMILVDSAQYGSSGKHSLAGISLAAGDVNNDGEINAMDAAWVLQRSAENGAGIS